MDGSFRIGSLFGIPVMLHFTFLLVIPLFAWIIGNQILLTVTFIEGVYSIAIDASLISTGYIPYILGFIVAIGLFIGVLVHEFAHSLVAKRSGIVINNITLLIFGGISSMEEGVPDPVTELPMALAGPVASLVVGLVTSALVYLVPTLPISPPSAGILLFLLGYLGILNIFLFLFNLLPAFPMDGGRVLRAILARRVSLARATKIAADIGKGFAVLFGIIGLVFLNPILIIIAVFIYLGADQEANMLRFTILLRDVTVGDIMSRPVITVPPTMPVREIVERMYASKHLGFPVEEHGALAGMITIADLHRTSSIDREALQVRDIMSRDLVTLSPSDPVMAALRLMSQRNIGRIPILDSGQQLVGIVTRTDILKVIELRDL